jgi:hypothetical protein
MAKIAVRTEGGQMCALRLPSARAEAHCSAPMNLLARFLAFSGDFEKTVADDHWSRLEPYFTEDVVYETYGDFGRRTEGRRAVFARLRKDLDAFDRRCQSRRVVTTSGPEVDDNRVLRSWVCTFHLDGAADLMIEGSERVTYDGGRIVMLEEELSEASERRLLAWIQLNPQTFAQVAEAMEELGDGD